MMMTMQYAKYNVVRICPVRMYGSSTGRAQIHVSKITVFVIDQNSTWLIGQNRVSRNFDLFVGIMNKIAIDIARAITPPSLFGIDRRIACANRKYHSGTIYYSFL